MYPSPLCDPVRSFTGKSGSSPSADTVGYMELVLRDPTGRLCGVEVGCVVSIIYHTIPPSGPVRNSTLFVCLFTLGHTTICWRLYFTIVRLFLVGLFSLLSHANPSPLQSPSGISRLFSGRSSKSQAKDEIPKVIPTAL